MRKYLWLAVFPTIVLSSFIIFRTSLTYYFFQDDWFVLSTINHVNLNNIFSLFAIRKDVIYYRPIGMQYFFFFSKSLFGLNPLGFHLISFLFHIVNIFLIGLISFQLFKSKFASAITSFFYADAPFHFMTLSWLSLTWNNIGTFFILASIYFSLRYLKMAKTKYYFFSLFMFLAAIFTTEFAIVTPFVIVLLGMLEIEALRTKRAKKLLLFLIPFVVVIAVYLTLRLLSLQIQDAGDYKIAFNSSVFKNLIWYAMWLTGIPQELKFNFIITQLKFAKTFLNAVGTNIPPLFVLWVTFIFSLFFSILKNKQSIKILILSTLIFLFGLTPVIFIPDHTFSYYLNISSLGIFIYIGYLLNENISKNYKSSFVINTLIISSWFFLCLLNNEISLKTNWVPGEAATSKDLTKLIQEASNSNFSNVYIKSEHNAKKTRQSLNNQRALQIILDNPNIKTYVRKKEQVINDYNNGILPNSENTYFLFYDK